MTDPRELIREAQLLGEAMEDEEGWRPPTSQLLHNLADALREGLE